MGPCSDSGAVLGYRDSRSGGHPKGPQPRKRRAWGVLGGLRGSSSCCAFASPLDGKRQILNTLDPNENFL